MVKMPDCHEYAHQGGTGSVNFLDNTITTQENKQLTSNVWEGVVREYVHQGSTDSVNLPDNTLTEVGIKFIDCLVTCPSTFDVEWSFLQSVWTCLSQSVNIISVYNILYIHLQ